MNKEGLKYNTERDKLIISEYGRNIQTMINHLLEIEDRKKEIASLLSSDKTLSNEERSQRMEELFKKLYDDISEKYKKIDEIPF